ncbi:hypothetical protein PR048_028094 [Dryococelus australis]|uniref:Uncharacterized protein n=1 Tax=Dryococelus australis TaxID=614101 RepID=A0ABQ9GI96_9NEOP|nr:hypothetical protein PR048_028094 [Dryococelus australis]
MYEVIAREIVGKCFQTDSFKHGKCKLVKGTGKTVSDSLLYSVWRFTNTNFMGLAEMVLSVSARTLASQKDQQGSIPGGVTPRIFARGNRTMRWLAGFLGDIPFPLLLGYDAAPYSPRFTLIGSQDLDALGAGLVSDWLLHAPTVSQSVSWAVGPTNGLPGGDWQTACAFSFCQVVLLLLAMVVAVTTGVPIPDRQLDTDWQEAAAARDDSLQLMQLLAFMK